MNKCTVRLTRASVNRLTAGGFDRALLIPFYGAGMSPKLRHRLEQDRN